MRRKLIFLHKFRSVSDNDVVEEHVYLGDYDKTDTERKIWHFRHDIVSNVFGEQHQHKPYETDDKHAK